MDDQELPNSPRKKLKLEEASADAKQTHTVSEAHSIPQVVPHNHTATSNHLLNIPATMVSPDMPTSSQTLSTTVDMSVLPTAKSEFEVEHSHNHSEAFGDLLDKKATNMAEAKSKIAGLADAVDNGESKEAACGITEFVSPDLLGFSGILKKRYTDFLVNEILPSGEVVHLDNLKAPPKPHKNTELSGYPDNASSAMAAEHETKIPRGDTEGNEEKQENSGTSPRPTFNNEPQTFPTPNTFKQEHPIPKPQAHLSNVEASQAVPQSMQGFNKYELASAPVDNEEKISPHKRLPPPAPSIPLSMQDLDDKKPEPEPEKATRRKEKVHIRQTSQGWVEFDKEKEDAIKKRKAEEDAAAGLQPEDVTQVEGMKSEETKDAPGPKELDVGQEPKASTQASWQAFASSAPSSSFELQPEDKNTLLSYFSSSIVDDILALYDRMVDSPHRKTRDYGKVKSGVIDRQKRKTIHQDIRRIFDSRLETVTDHDGAMIITAMAEKPTFYARNPTDANTRNNERGNHRGNDRGHGRINGRGSGKAGGRGHDDRSKAQASGGARAKPTWDDLGGKYLHFSLYKENKDTMEAISWLAKQVRMQPRSFQFAGTKDRRAVTVQRVSVERVYVQPMISAGRTLRNAYIGNFEYRPHRLQLGELTGNEFVITLRDCDFHYPVPLESKYVLEGAQAIVGEAIQNLRERGFVNYYGLQRFGTFTIGTEVVGLKILQGDFQGAVDAILDYSPACLEAAQDPASENTNKVSVDDRARAHALHSYRTTNRSGHALQELPRRYSAESSIIRHLTGRSEHREDYLGALQTISRNLRLMYVHAYQSLVWNVAASERWKRFGLSVTEGDLVLVEDNTDKAEGVIKAEEVDADGEAIVLPGTDDRAANPDDLFERARPLTKEEAESGRYSIFDIVLPTPGYDIIYPPNEMEKFYEDFMASERGGGLNPHDMRRQWKDASLSGSYRKILARPGKDISFEIKAYKNEDEQFVMTDMERLRPGSGPQKNGYPKREHENPAHQNSAAGSLDVSKQATSPAQQHDDSEMKHDDKTVSNGNHTGDKVTRVKTPSQESEDMEQGGVSLIGGAYRDYKIAVIIKMQLGSSQYATMALRELLKAGGLKTYKADFSGGR